MKTALMIAGGVGLVGYLIYRANVSSAPVTGTVAVPPGAVPPAVLSAAVKSKIAAITAAGVQATTASS